MNDLFAEDVETFLDRFYAFDEAIIRTLNEADNSVIFEVSSKDRASDAGWSNVIIIFGGIKESRLQSADSEYQIITWGLTIRLIDLLFYVDFGSADCPESVAEFRESPFYVACDRIQWTDVPYNDFL